MPGRVDTSSVRHSLSAQRVCVCVESSLSFVSAPGSHLDSCCCCGAFSTPAVFCGVAVRFSTPAVFCAAVAMCFAPLRCFASLLRCVLHPCGVLCCCCTAFCIPALFCCCWLVALRFAPLWRFALLLRCVLHPSVFCLCAAPQCVQAPHVYPPYKSETETFSSMYSKKLDDCLSN